MCTGEFVRKIVMFRSLLIVCFVMPEIITTKQLGASASWITGAMIQTYRFHLLY